MGALFVACHTHSSWTDPGPLQLSGSRPRLRGDRKDGVLLALRCPVHKSLPAVVVLRITAQGTAR